MSYRSRLYNQRNAQSPELNNDKSFFSIHHGGTKMNSKGAFFQAKLAVNKPGDKYEQEADSVAHAVVNNKTPTWGIQQKKISSIQRLATTLEDEKVSTNDQRMDRDKEKPFQRMTAEPEKDKMKGVQKMVNPEKEKMKGVQKKEEPMKEEEKKKTTAVQTKQDGTATTASSKIESSAGKGNNLSAKTQKEMSSSFGADFSNVRVHNGNEAATMNEELNAQAFTHGSDIYFNEGKFDPNSSTGKFLLAHELAHVIQQKNSILKVQLAPNDRSRESKPTDAPRGTKPIDEMGLDKDKVHGIKDGVGAGPKDWVGISPEGHVITSDGDGHSVDHGPAEDYLPKVGLEELSLREKIANALNEAGIPPWAVAGLVVLVIAALLDPEPFSKVALIIGAAAAIAVFIAIGRQSDLPPNATASVANNDSGEEGMSVTDEQQSDDFSDIEQNVENEQIA